MAPAFQGDHKVGLHPEIHQYFNRPLKVEASNQKVQDADIAYFIGEDAPKMAGITNPSRPAGYDYNYINANVLHIRTSGLPTPLRDAK